MMVEASATPGFVVSFFRHARVDALAVVRKPFPETYRNQVVALRKMWHPLSFQFPETALDEVTSRSVYCRDTQWLPEAGGVLGRPTCGRRSRSFWKTPWRRLVAGGLAGLEISPGRPTLAPDTENLVFFKIQAGSSIFKLVSN